MSLAQLKNTVWMLFCLLFSSQSLLALGSVEIAPREILIKIKPAKTTPHNFIFSIERAMAVQSQQLFTNPEHGLHNIYKLILPDSIDGQLIISTLESDPSVEYVQFNNIYQLDFLPNDPHISDQWVIPEIALTAAWDFERGSKDVLVAIIDTGIDDAHEDLASNIWINSIEDLNGNGKADSSDFNSIDDDQNGFIDDIRGWDFTDAPYFPDGGDYLERDNNPQDEHGHGTNVAGIVGAVADNSIGIAGIAHGCRLLNLRAGTSQGLLEEDDVASAIVYAVDNGAHIINMSFGDVVASPLLQDVMRYAYTKNVILVASAGNSAVDDIHYPSGYNQTISVGATTIQGALASFSNYGATIDLVAPGVNIFTTQLNDHYAGFGGTSAAAPVVSGVAALLKSRNIDLTNEDIRNILISTTDDFGSENWDQYYGAGRVNAAKALQVNIVSETKISSPELDMGFFASPVKIIGTASGAFLDSYELLYGIGDNPGNWVRFERILGRQVINDTLGIWDFSSLPDSSYTLRLIVNNKDGSAVEQMTRIFIDRSVPVSYDISTKPMIDGAFPSVLVEFRTDDLCRSSIHYRKMDSNAAFEEIHLKYTAREHRYNFTHERGKGQFEYIIVTENVSGLVSQTEVIKEPPIYLRENDISGYTFDHSGLVLPSGYMLNVITDFDGDGQKEVVINEYKTGSTFDKLKILEYANNNFESVFESQLIMIPRDFGDSDGDGFKELLVGSGASSYILESVSADGYPGEIVWADTSGFWASRFTDLDDDGVAEIIGRIDDTFIVREHAGESSYIEIARLENPTPGSNGSGVPHTEVGDFDGDNRKEILIGDSDGDLFLYEANGDNSFASIWQERQPLQDCTNFISSGDYDGDGIPEFAVGSHSSPDLNAEHEYDARHWIVRIYKAVSNDSYSIVWEQAFFGFEAANRAANGFSSGDVDHDSRDELILNLFPDIYVVDFDDKKAGYTPIFHASPSQSQANIIGDVDNDGINEFFVNRGSEITSFIHSDAIAAQHQHPSGFDAWPLGTAQVWLHWNEIPVADKYLIYRGKNSGLLKYYTSTTETLFIDTAVEKDSIYYYSVRDVVLADTSRFAPIIKVVPGERPFVQAVVYIAPNQLRLTYSEEMSQSIKEVAGYKIDIARHRPSSVITTKSMREVILTMDGSVASPGSHTISVHDVADSDRTPIDTFRNQSAFQIPEELNVPYLLSASQLNPRIIELLFSVEMDSLSAININNYEIQPDIPVANAQIDDIDSRKVLLHLDESATIRALGLNYIITVRNLISTDGVSIPHGQGSQASLFLFRNDLSDVFTYPNPFHFGNGVDLLTFANLTQEAEIKIITLEGIVIRRIYENDGNGGAEWDLKDENGSLVSSGIYLFQVQGNGQRTTGKLAIVR